MKGLTCRKLLVRVSRPESEDEQLLSPWRGKVPGKRASTHVLRNKTAYATNLPNFEKLVSDTEFTSEKSDYGSLEGPLQPQSRLLV
jgi:hypothetical protein